MSDDYKQRRQTFDEIAGLYDEMRPTYPDALFDDLVSVSQVPDGGRILEIGSGTGQATLPFAQRGYAVQGVELGADLAEIANRNLADYPDAQVAASPFEAYPIEPGVYDLVIAASAFHWIDPAVRYQKVHSALKPGCMFALFWNMHVKTDMSSDFYDAIEGVYQSAAPELKLRPPMSIEAAHAEAQELAQKMETDSDRLFGQATVRTYPFNMRYSADGYTRLMNTHSNHVSLAAETRARLFEGIVELIDTKFGGQVTKEYLAVLNIVQRN